MTKTVLAYQTKRDEDYSVHEFTYKDRFGRGIGAGVQQYTIDFLDYVPDPAQSFRYTGYDLPAGEYYALNVQSTRGGERYGASQNTQYFATRDERSAALAKRMKAMAKGAKHREGK